MRISDWSSDVCSSDLPREQSYFWQQVVDDLRRQGLSKIDISEGTGVPVQELEALLFGLANMVSIDGEGAQTPARKVSLRVGSEERRGGNKWVSQGRSRWSACS